MNKELIEKAKKLDFLKQEKKAIEDHVKEMNKDISRLEGELIQEMLDAGTIAIKDADSGKTFSIQNAINVAQTDYAKENDTEFAKVFAENGFDIFKYSCHYQTLGGAVRKEIIQKNEFGELELPKWAEPFVEISEFQKISIR